jgi:hypothetical protein
MSTTAKQLFGAIFERSHQNQDIAAFFIEPNVEVNSIGPTSSHSGW